MIQILGRRRNDIDRRQLLAARIGASGPAAPGLHAPLAWLGSAPALLAAAHEDETRTRFRTASLSISLWSLIPAAIAAGTLVRTAS
jgi:hypothetical protein